MESSSEILSTQVLTTTPRYRVSSMNEYGFTIVTFHQRLNDAMVESRFRDGVAEVVDMVSGEPLTSPPIHQER